MKAIYHVINNNINPNTLIEIEENPFLVIEQQDIVPIPMLQKLGCHVPDVYMAVLWNPGGQTVILKRNMTIGYVKEADYMEKGPLDQHETVRKMTEIQPPTTSFDTVGE